MVKSAIIPAAGLGTRMIPYSKEVPKEMLPILVRDNGIVVEPVLHFIFDSLYDVGVRTFFFIVGRSKRVIEDYFTPDWDYVSFLKEKGKTREAEVLERLYNRLDDVSILMVNQPTPRGFGDAILRTRYFMVHESFIVHAGDDITFPDHVLNIRRLIEHFEKEKPKAVFLYTRSDHPEKYGVIIGEEADDYIIVKDIMEKPKHPPTNKVVVALYVFDKVIYEALEEVKPDDPGKEHQLTDAIKLLVNNGEKVHAIPVIGKRLDFGTPDHYYESLRALIEANEKS